MEEFLPKRVETTLLEMKKAGFGLTEPILTLLTKLDEPIAQFVLKNSGYELTEEQKKFLETKYKENYAALAKGVQDKRK